MSDGSYAKPGAWIRPGGRIPGYAGLDLFVYRVVAESALDSKIFLVTWNDLGGGGGERYL